MKVSARLKNARGKELKCTPCILMEDELGNEHTFTCDERLPVRDASFLLKVLMSEAHPIDVRIGSDSFIEHDLPTMEELDG